MMTAVEENTVEYTEEDSTWMQQKFDRAVDMLKELPTTGKVSPTNEEKLRLYSLFKQATEGPCNISKPGFWDVVSRAKWEAWHKLGSMNRYEAMEEYIVSCVETLNKYADSPVAAGLARELENMIFEDDKSGYGHSPSPGLYETIVEEEGSPLGQPRTLTPSVQPYKPALQHPRSFPETEQVPSRAQSRLESTPFLPKPVATLRPGRTGSFMTPMPSAAVAAPTIDIIDEEDVAPATDAAKAATAKKVTLIEDLVNAVISRLRDLEVRVANMSIVPRHGSTAFIKSDAHLKRLRGSVAVIYAFKAQSRLLVKRAVQGLLVALIICFIFGVKKGKWPINLDRLRTRAILYLLGQNNYSRS